MRSCVRSRSWWEVMETVGLQKDECHVVMADVDRE